MSVGVVACYAYVFENKGFYQAYVPTRDIDEYPLVDEGDFLGLCGKDPLFRELTLVSVCKTPRLGKKVDCGRKVVPIRILCTELNQLKLIGKFELSGKCTLLSLDDNELSLSPPELIKTARVAYLQYGLGRKKRGCILV